MKRIKNKLYILLALLAFCTKTTAAAKMSPGEMKVCFSFIFVLQSIKEGKEEHETLKRLIAKYPNHVRKYGHVYLCAAAQIGSKAACDLLLAGGAQKNLKHENKYPYQFAVTQDLEDLLSL